jgi:hypothetical protein
MTTNTRHADDQVARRLAAYAAARLSPTPDATARMRARVMAAASSTAVVPAPRPVSAPISLAAYRTRLGGRSRVAAALLAAALSVLLVTGAAFASTAGGPLYGVRLWVESVSLPSEPGARTDADVDRLEARLDEAVRAARTGNSSGIAAALAAYRDVLDDALKSDGESLTRSDRLETALARHQLVLATLLEYAPEPARDALQRAIDRRDEAVDRIKKDHPDKPGKGPAAHPTPRAGGGHPTTPPRGGSGSGGRPSTTGGGKARN